VSAARIFRSLAEARGAFAPSAVTIGNFDGVHAGHRELLRRTRLLAHARGAKPSALTFHPHPTVIVAPERAPKLLTTPEERCALLAEEGMEQVLILPFDGDVASLEPFEFFRHVLMDDLGACAVCVGDNFHFGRKQAGQVYTLTELGQNFGVQVEIVEAVRRRGVAVSSSTIRRLLAEGNVSRAARLLERPYALAGEVVPGEGRGGRQTVPTLNLEVHSLDHIERAIPATGVYITRTADLDTARRWHSITNVGYRPTFQGRHLTIETFLLHPLDGAPPVRIRVEFLRRVREERVFPSAEELRVQILADVGRAQTFFRRTAKAAAALPSPPPRR
jgi:riboflavin kinase/FMN adenylyltransferase